MNAVHKGNTIFSQSDDLYIHPEKYFRKKILASMDSYQIFTGVGFVFTALGPRLQVESWYFKDRTSLDRFLRQEKDGIYAIENCFYAYVIQQNLNDPFE